MPLLRTLSLACAALILASILIFAGVVYHLYALAARLKKTLNSLMVKWMIWIPTSNEQTTWPFPSRTTQPPVLPPTVNVSPTREDDTKIKCKQCHKKFKLRSPKDVDCNKPDCCLKYGLSTVLLNFDGVQESWLKDVQVIAKFETERYESTPMTQHGWEGWATRNIGSSKSPGDYDGYNG